MQEKRIDDISFYHKIRLTHRASFIKLTSINFHEMNEIISVAQITKPTRFSYDSNITNSINTKKKRIKKKSLLGTFWVISILMFPIICLNI